ncbi:hypothetical protein [Naumannella huperziae]
MQAADDIVDQYDYTTAVKSLFRDYITETDPGATVSDTGYFNHSAVPDYVLKWNRSEKRLVYLRRSYEEIAGNADADRFSATDNLVVSLNEAAGESIAESRIRERIENSGENRLLVTGGLALDRFAERLSSSAAASPISTVVSGQVLHSGRGLIDAEQAERLMSAQSGITSDIERNFLPEMAEQLRASVEIVAAMSDPALPPPGSSELLTISSARAVLPWLLRQDNRRSDDEFWAALGSRVTLETLTSISDDLAGLDLTPLVSASWSTWLASRGAIGLAPPDEVEEEVRWQLVNRVLTRTQGSDALRFATYGQALKARGLQSSALWQVVSSLLPADSRVLEIELRGVDRSITLRANESPNLHQDVEDVVGSVQDNFYVERLVVQLGRVDEDRQVELAFGDRMAYGSGNATLKDLAELLAGTVAYRNPISLQ